MPSPFPDLPRATKPFLWCLEQFPGWPKMPKVSKSHFQYLKMSQGNVQSYHVIYDREIKHIKHGTVGLSEACGHFFAETGRAARSALVESDVPGDPRWSKATPSHRMESRFGSHCKECSTLWRTNILPWKITIFNGKIHYQWPFSIAMLVHQRVIFRKA